MKKNPAFASFASHRLLAALPNQNQKRLSWLRLTFSLIAALELSASLLAQESARLTPDEILKRVTYPSEFQATVFAAPPDISYPIFISAAPDGILFVGCDENGSLDQRPGHPTVVAPGATALALFTRMSAERPKGVFRPIMAEDLVTLFERGYAESMAWRKNKGVSAAEVVKAAQRKAS